MKTQKTALNHILLPALTFLAFLPGAASAAPLVFSTFTDSTLGVTGRTTVVTTNNSNLTPWWLATSDTSSRMEVVDDVGGLGKSATLARSEAGLTNFSSISLSDGQSVKLTLNYRYSGDPVSGGELRVLLYDSGTAPLPNSDQSITSTTVREEYAGYFFSVGTAVATTGVSQTFIRKREAGNANALNSGSGTTSFGGSTLGVASGVTSHLVEITLSRNSSDLNMVIDVDGSNVIDRTDSTGALFDFDTFIISNNSSADGGTIFLDNLQVNVVPEPGTISLLGLGGGLLLLAVGRYGFRIGK